MNDYYSFLICQHPDKADIYFNGLPVGTVKDGAFKIHEFTLPDGTKKPLKFKDLMAPRPFMDDDELKLALRNIIDAIRL